LLQTKKFNPQTANNGPVGLMLLPFEFMSPPSNSNFFPLTPPKV